MAFCPLSFLLEKKLFLTQTHIYVMPSSSPTNFVLFLFKMEKLTDFGIIVYLFLEGRMTES